MTEHLRPFTFAGRCAGTALIGCALLVSTAASADCNIYPFSISQPAVERFIMRPNRLLEEYREGGSEMSSLVSLIAASSRAVLPAIINQARMSNPQQRRAIAAGLANAAKLCAIRSPETVKLIDDTVRKQTETSFQLEFRQSFTNDRQKPETDVATATKMLQQKPDDSGNALFSPSSPGPIGRVGTLNTVPQIRRYDLPIR